LSTTENDKRSSNLNKNTMIKNATEFLRECRKDKAFKKAVDAIDNQHIIDFAEAYAELRLSNVVGRSEQLPKNNCTLNRQTCGKGSGCKYPHCHI
jgi:hypothetical protein